MTFSVTILGCSSAIPTTTRNPSAQLVNANDKLFMIDCAEGTQLQIRKFHQRFQRIRFILVSHLHGDHFYGLIGLITSFHLLGRKDELHIFGLPLLSEIIDMQLNASQTKLNYPLLFHDLDPSSESLIYEDDKFEITTIPLDHSIPTCGFLFREKKPARNATGARSYAYCSDTRYNEKIAKMVKNVSLLYHETTFLQDRAKDAHDKYHSTTVEAAGIAKLANAGRLMIGHYSARYDDITPLLDEARSVFPDTIAAEDGLVVDV